MVYSLRMKNTLRIVGQFLVNVLDIILLLYSTELKLISLKVTWPTSWLQIELVVLSSKFLRLQTA